MIKTINRGGDVTNWVNGHWEVNWIPYRQQYTIHYKGLLFAVKYRFRDVEKYLK